MAPTTFLSLPRELRQQILLQLRTPDELLEASRFFTIPGGYRGPYPVTDIDLTRLLKAHLAYTCPLPEPAADMDYVVDKWYEMIQKLKQEPSRTSAQRRAKLRELARESAGMDASLMGFEIVETPEQREAFERATRRLIELRKERALRTSSGDSPTAKRVCLSYGRLNYVPAPTLSGPPRSNLETSTADLYASANEDKST